MEIWIVAFYSLAWVLALEYRRTGKFAWVLASLAAAGALSVVKSPLYSVLWVLGYWLFIILSKDWKAFARPSFWIAHFAGIAVGASWYVAILMSDREKFWSDYVIRETLSKSGGNSSTIGHMWADFSTFCVPFLFQAIVMVAFAFRKRHRAILPLFLGWGALPAIFFSAFPYRTETYLYILIPLLAVLMDLHSSLDEAEIHLLGWANRINGILIFSAGILIAWICQAAGMIPGLNAILLALTAMGFGAASFHENLANREGTSWKWMAGFALSLAFAIRLGAISLGEQDIATFRETLRSMPEKNLVFLDQGKNIWHETGLLSVAAGRPGIRATNSAEFTRALRDGAVGVLSDGDWPEALPRFEHEMAEKGLTLEVREWWRWKRSFQVPSFADLTRMSGRDAPGWQDRNQREYKIVWVRPSSLPSGSGTATSEGLHQGPLDPKTVH